jgi:hypothetical protein
MPTPDSSSRPVEGRLTGELSPLERRAIDVKRQAIGYLRTRLRRGPQPEVVVEPELSVCPVTYVDAPADLDPGIGELSYYRGCLHVRGWAGGADMVASIGYLTEDGTAVEVGRFPAEVSGGRRDFEFDVAILDREQAMRTELVMELASGRMVKLGELARFALDVDPVTRLNGRFQDGVSSMARPRLLEVGSRARSGNVYRSWLAEDAQYVGFDILPGPNVDIVGDAHRLSRFVEPGSIDAIYSVSTMEHLAMPWLAAAEMNRVLRVGGLVFVASHQTWPVHDAPWDFYRFSEYAWATLFNKFSGFEIIQTASGEPARVVAKVVHDSTSALELEPAYLSSAVLARKVAETALDWAADPAAVIADAYPQ